MLSMTIIKKLLVHLVMVINYLIIIVNILENLIGKILMDSY